jgi:hypothetical protein
MDDTPLPPAPAPRPSRLRRAWRIIKGLAVAAFVVWHLFFLVYRNVADLWGDDLVKKAQAEKDWEALEPRLKKAARPTRLYAAYAGQEQGWCMFASPLARKAYFPAVRIYFDDGSDELVTSGNEPDPTHYRRFGGWRQRKIEDIIAYGDEKKVRDEEAALWANYAVWMYHKWREAHPDDSRQAARLALLSRLVRFPELGKPHAYPEVETYTIAIYTPDGRLVE